MLPLIHKFVEINKKVCKWFCDAFPKFFREGENYLYVLLSEITKLMNRGNIRRVLEVGGTDRPLLQKRPYMQYNGLDIEYKEKCLHIYDRFFHQSIEEPIEGYYDLIFSTTLLEHVQNNSLSFKHIYDSLNDSAATIHYLPSKNHPYSVILRLVGAKLQKKIISVLRPWAANVTGYNAFFDKCSPREMENLLQRIGFKDIEIIPFYRANDYFCFFTPLFILITIWENFCRKFKLRQFCSGFIVIAYKA